MIRLNSTSNQIRVDTSIKIIEVDGNEIKANVMILIGVSKMEIKQQRNIYQISNGLFNKSFILDRRPKPQHKKTWWAFWKS